MITVVPIVKSVVASIVVPLIVFAVEAPIGVFSIVPAVIVKSAATLALGNAPVTLEVRSQYVVEVDPVPPPAIGRVPIAPFNSEADTINLIKPYLYF